MKLTSYEKEMLEGLHGWPKQKGMEILCQIGELYDAEKMLPIQNAHMVNASVQLSGAGAMSLAEKLLKLGGKFVTRTTLNPASVDFDRWEEIGFTKQTFAQQSKLTNLYHQLGAIPVHCCTPYLVGTPPVYGEHICWGESSAVIYANSVIGARSNRNGGPVALAASLTGVVPAYGYHLDENRQGNVIVHVKTPLRDVYDYGLLGYAIGELVEDGVPVFTGINTNVSPDQLKQLGSSLATTGAVALFHAVGITPEAPTLEKAIGSSEVSRIIEIGEAELAATGERLNENVGSDFSIVYIGCPHASIQEIAEIASYLEGKTVTQNMLLWIQTGQPIKALAERCGYSKTINDAGALLVIDTCPVHGFTPDFLALNSFKAMATNSPKIAHYCWSIAKIPTAVFSVRDCVEIALNGRI